MWVPDASVNVSRLSQDVVDVASAGGGGVEVLGYYLYDSAPGDFAPSVSLPDQRRCLAKARRDSLAHTTLLSSLCLNMR